MWKTGNHHTQLVGIKIGASTVENSMEVSQSLKIKPPYDPEIPLPGMYTKKKKKKIQRNPKHQFENIHPNVQFSRSVVSDSL